MNIHKVDFVNCCDMAHIGSTRCDLSTALLADSPARVYTDVGKKYDCNQCDYQATQKSHLTTHQ